MNTISLWALILTTGLACGVTFQVVRRESVRLARRKLIAQCLSSDAEQAEFFAQCWSVGRDK
jgi:hypothetical protein